MATNLPVAEKNRLLLKVVTDRAAAVSVEMLRRYRDQHATIAPVPPRRTVADLLDGPARRRADRSQTMITTRGPSEYDAAVALLTDLRDLAQRDGHAATFTRRSLALRQSHARKPSLIERLDRAGIDGTGTR